MNQRKVAIVILAIMTAVLLLNSSVFDLMADDDVKARETLKGLKGVYVWVNFSTSDSEALEKTGLSEEIIRTDVELKLRLAGINVVSKEEIYSVPGMPQLAVQIAEYVTSTLPSTQDRQIAFNICVELLQAIYLARNPTITTVTRTWSSGSIGMGYTNKNIVTQIRNCIKDHVDSFINAYLSVNPKGGN